MVFGLLTIGAANERALDEDLRHRVPARHLRKRVLDLRPVSCMRSRAKSHIAQPPLGEANTAAARLHPVRTKLVKLHDLEIHLELTKEALHLQPVSPICHQQGTHACMQKHLAKSVDNVDKAGNSPRRSKGSSSCCTQSRCASHSAASLYQRGWRPMFLQSRFCLRLPMEPYTS